MQYSTKTIIAAAFAAFLCIPQPAAAGVPECNNLRLQDVGDCELRGDVDCNVGCDELGVYKKACATELRTVCSSECTLSADATCEDDCTRSCTETCDRGENVICLHNCFDECVPNCDVTCADADDEAQCRASCEANCDAECDIKCKPLVDGDCYEHCIECCGGSCTAQANMDCQVSCQEEEFETCEHELRADCDASCSGTGAIFCDGEYVLSGEEIPACVTALAAEGIADIDLEASASVSVDDGVAEGKGALGCSAGDSNAGSGLLAWVLLAVGVAWRRRLRLG